MAEVWVEVDVVLKRMYRKERMLKWPGHTTLLSGTVRLPSEKAFGGGGGGNGSGEKAKIVWPFFGVLRIGANEMPANELCCHPLRRALCSFCTPSLVLRQPFSNQSFTGLATLWLSLPPSLISTSKSNCPLSAPRHTRSTSS
jgi:hypothetical protein